MSNDEAKFYLLKYLVQRIDNIMALTGTGIGSVYEKKWDMRRVYHATYKLVTPFFYILPTASCFLLHFLFSHFYTKNAPETFRCHIGRMWECGLLLCRSLTVANRNSLDVTYLYSSKNICEQKSRWNGPLFKWRSVDRFVYYCKDEKSARSESAEKEFTRGTSIFLCKRAVQFSNFLFGTLKNGF